MRLGECRKKVPAEEKGEEVIVSLDISSWSSVVGLKHAQENSCCLL